MVTFYRPNDCAVTPAIHLTLAPYYHIPSTTNSAAMLTITTNDRAYTPAIYRPNNRTYTPSIYRPNDRACMPTIYEPDNRHNDMPAT